MKAEVSKSILVINTGSSSVKFQLFLKTAQLELLAKGSVSNLDSEPIFSTHVEKIGKSNQLIDKKMLPANFTHEEALQLILHWIESQSTNWQVSAVAHRIVHGGAAFHRSVRLTPEIINRLWELCPLAPSHQPHNLAAIEIVAKFKPDIPQIACFDTAFHAIHERLFTEYALPQTLRQKGIRRYGFHGLSYEWLVHTLQSTDPQLAKGRIIAAHLGNGASLCAIEAGVSMDTTMGMTALDGLPMGTRCGNLDPGAVLYMIRELGLSSEETEAILYQESGLLGLSEWTGDVRLLQDSLKPDAQFALDYFCLRSAQFMGMMAVALGGVDGIVFTGGIGENSSVVRDKIINRLDFLKPFTTHVIPANEEKMMAIHTLAVL